MPQVVVLAGPNGAGKTTVSKTLLSEILHSKAFVNADAIAQGLNGLAPETQAFRAGRLMLQQLDEFAQAVRTLRLKPPCQAEPTLLGCANFAMRATKSFCFTRG